jgi:hypothetical protein
MRQVRYVLLLPAANRALYVASAKAWSTDMRDDNGQKLAYVHFGG